MNVARRHLPPEAEPRRGVAERLSAVAPRAVRGGGVRRRLFVSLAKRLLPVAAVAILALVALWPEFSSQLEQGRYTYHVGAGTPEGGALTDARYRGVDQQGRPFTVTAVQARQAGHQRTDLVEPKADITLGADGWMMVQAARGVYMQGSNQLDLSGDVTLYRDDGTTLTTDAVTVDLGAGAASSAAKVHVEGPFGTLDAQGFTVLDRGTAVQFSGPGRLVLNGGGK